MLNKRVQTQIKTNGGEERQTSVRNNSLVLCWEIQMVPPGSSVFFDGMVGKHGRVRQNRSVRGSGGRLLMVRSGASVSPKPDNGSDFCSEVVGQFSVPPRCAGRRP